MAKYVFYIPGPFLSEAFFIRELLIAPCFFQQLCHRALHLIERSLYKRRSGNEHQAQSAAKPVGLQPVAFPQQSLGSRAFHAVADFFADRKTNARSAPCFGNDEHHCGIVIAFSAPVSILKLGVPQQPLIFCKGEMRSHGKKSLSATLSGKNLAAFAAPARKHLHTRMGLHPSAKTMDLFALAALGLVCLKHFIHSFIVAGNPGSATARLDDIGWHPAKTIKK